MKNIKKKIAAGVAFALVCAITVTAIFVHSSQTVEANEVFNGIDSIISYNNEANPFNVVELVPDRGMAEIGYLMDGQEPDNWLGIIAGLVSDDTDAGTKKRSDYILALKTRLDSITETDGSNSKPLHYNTYSESYVEKDGMTVLPLSSIEKIAKDTTGYKMNDVGIGNGSFEFNCEYAPVAIGGDYDQNVDYYIYSGAGYYGIVFEPFESDGVIDIVDQLNGEDAYTVKSAYAYVSKAKVDELCTDSPNAYLYKADNSDTTKPYEFVGRAGDLTGSTDVLDFESYTYFTLKLEKVPDEELVDGKTYYVVSEGGVTFYPDSDGEYGAALDTEEPYIEVDPGLGNFELVYDSEVYSYVGEANGSFELVESAGDKLDYPVNVNFIYYKGGFKNNNWFQNGVFNQNDKLDKSLYFSVNTLDCDSFMVHDLSDVDMLYISNKASKINSGITTNFSNDNDIDWITLRAIIVRVTNQSIKMPVIVDHSILDGANVANGTYMQKLAALLCAKNLEDFNITNTTTESDIDWSKIQYASDNDNDGHFVNGCVYSIPGNSNSDIPYLFKKFTTNFVSSTDADDFINDARAVGFEEIAESINQENLIRKTENESGANYEYFDLDISKAIVVEYIISYVSKRAKTEDTGLKILDIEPSAAKASTSGVFTYDSLRKLLGNNCPEKDKVSITYVNSSQFIGKIEDLNDYDLIYLGLSTEKMNKDNSGNTVYNDTSMNGLIYTNIGDICTIYPNQENGHSGLLENDYVHNGNRRVRLDETMTNKYSGNYTTAINTYRYSGNDFTEEKVTAIKKYLKGGFPIIIADGFISNNNVNTKYIDNCSNIYKLINDIKDSEYVMTMTKAGKKSEDLHKYLTTNKPELLLAKLELEPNTVYSKLNGNTISLDFVINNNGGVDLNAKFNATLMLDTNADGKFSMTQEAIAATSVKIYKNGKLVNPTKNSDGKYVYNLPAGTENAYTLSYNLPSGYIGIIPWKLNVSQSTNEYRYDSEQGYVYKENSANERERIKILQINSERATTFDMGAALNPSSGSYDKTFADLVNNLDDFELDIKTVSADTYKRQYKKGYLNEYDMIIMGFGDCYSISNTNGCLEAIRTFISDGNPVLFTHDATSFSNDSVGSNNWGYEFNTIIRDVVGMDRYGVLNNDGTKSGVALYANADVARANGYYYYTNADKAKYDAAVKYAKDNNTDLAYKPNSNKQVITRQNQGFTYLDIARYQYTDNNYYSYLAYSGLTARTDAKTQKVKQVNSGQITSYPFILPETFNIAQTHRQYYQLDMNQDGDKDGESDIVVWYTLTENDDNSTNNYNASPCDVRNNYYIYTMGNVTYSGVGHSSIKGQANELKLYINTMIAAYSSGVHAPEVKIKASADEDAESLETVYVSMDDILEEQIEGKEAKEDVFFTVEDNNLLRTGAKKVEYAAFYIPVSKSEFDQHSNSKNYTTINDGGSTVYLKNLEWDIYAVNDAYNTVKTEGLESGLTYRTEVPLSILDNNTDSLQIYLLAYTRIIKNVSEDSDKKTIDTPVAFDSFKIQRVGLSDLD